MLQARGIPLHPSQHELQMGASSDAIGSPVDSFTYCTHKTAFSGASTFCVHQQSVGPRGRTHVIVLADHQQHGVGVLHSALSFQPLSVAIQSTRQPAAGAQHTAEGGASPTHTSAPNPSSWGSSGTTPPSLLQQWLCLYCGSPTHNFPLSSSPSTPTLFLHQGYSPAAGTARSNHTGCVIRFGGPTSGGRYDILGGGSFSYHSIN
uniref:uncharacterized protein LOC131111063 isoform X2 n=1 Tax=Doryrhamphus excisus TaxID=161450 RepID=UPI0025AEA3BE|nr:uncharacterized protein LOC131111063 isoform X2 [Doryrhamphus excisus]